MAQPFFPQLEAQVASKNSLLCVGLDPHAAELESAGFGNNAEGATQFCLKLIDATSHVAVAYKPNAAFFEQFGSEGWKALEAVVKAIPGDIPIVFDAKRGDIGSTSAAYALGNFKMGGNFPCLTVSPYLGHDGVTPFVDTPEKAAFVLCKTSNPGSNDLQTLLCGPDQTPLYIKVAELCEKWGSAHKNVGVVVGATDVDAIKNIRSKFPQMWMLAPGIGAQGGPLKEAMAAGLTSDGKKSGILFPISRGISKAADPKAAAEDFVVQMNEIRAAFVPSEAQAAGGKKGGCPNPNCTCGDDCQCKPGQPGCDACGDFQKAMKAKKEAEAAPAAAANGSAGGGCCGAK